MFCGNNLISVLNTKTSKAETLTIDEFWKSVMEKAWKFNSAYLQDASAVDFSGDYMIRDGGGYTQLNRIVLNNGIPNPQWNYKIESSNNAIYLHSDSLIYVFDTNEEPSIGFHGIRNYKRKSKILGHYVRVNNKQFQVYRLSEDNSLMENFESVKISEYEDKENMYALMTKSKTFNCNGFLVPDSSASDSSLNFFDELLGNSINQ